MPRAMNERDLTEVREAFATAATRAVAAGFRWLELHFAHGYLVHEFLSPLSNRREDNHGGTFENRTRLARDIVRAVRRVWPERFPLAIRLSCTDWVEGGWTLEESIDLARQLRPEGVDLIDCSSGALVPGVKIPEGPGYQVALRPPHPDRGPGGHRRGGRAHRPGPGGDAGSRRRCGSSDGRAGNAARSRTGPGTPPRRSARRKPAASPGSTSARTDAGHLGRRPRAAGPAGMKRRGALAATPGVPQGVRLSGTDRSHFDGGEFRGEGTPAVEESPPQVEPQVFHNRERDTESWPASHPSPIIPHLRR